MYIFFDSMFLYVISAIVFLSLKQTEQQQKLFSNTHGFLAECFDCSECLFPLILDLLYFVIIVYWAIKHRPEMHYLVC